MKQLWFKIKVNYDYDDLTAINIVEAIFNKAIPAELLASRDKQYNFLKWPAVATEAIATKVKNVQPLNWLLDDLYLIIKIMAELTATSQNALFQTSWWASHTSYDVGAYINYSTIPNKTKAIKITNDLNKNTNIYFNQIFIKI